MEENYDNMMDFLDEYVSKKNENVTPKPKLPNKEEKIDNNFTPKTEKSNKIPEPKVVKNHNFDSTKYEDVVINDLPLGSFYKPGTKIKFRECTVKEIQNYSTLDETSIFDFKRKLNEILEECILFYNPDGTLGTYEQIFEGDRLWFIYLIREKTFPKGKTLSVPVSYNDENGENKKVKIELLRKNLEVWKDQEIMEFFDKEKRCFVFNTTLREEPIYMKPPTIGLKSCFDHYLKVKKEKGKEINSTFFKIAPFLNLDSIYMNWDDFEKYEQWFESELSIEEYEFLFDIINNHLKIGIRGIKKNVGGSVIRSRRMYPIKLKTLFVFSNAFRLYLRQ